MFVFGFGFFGLETENWAARDGVQGKCLLLCLVGITATTNPQGEEGGYQEEG
jgi:hypothetical protein